MDIKLSLLCINCPSYPSSNTQLSITKLTPKKSSSIPLLLWSPRPSPPRHQANQKILHLLLLWSPRPSPPRHQANQQANKKNHLLIAPLCIRMYGMEDNLVFVNSTSNGLWLWIFPKDDKKRQLQTLTVVILRAYLTWLYSQGYPQYQQKIEIWILDYQAPRTQNNPV